MCRAKGTREERLSLPLEAAGTFQAGFASCQEPRGEAEAACPGEGGSARIPPRSKGAGDIHSPFRGEAQERQCHPAAGQPLPRVHSTESLRGSRKYSERWSTGHVFLQGGNKAVLLPAERGDPMAPNGVTLHLSMERPPPRPLWAVTTATTDSWTVLKIPELLTSVGF